MSEVLSKEEIDQLLTAINCGGDSEPEIFKAPERRIKIYDFKRPDKFTRENMRSVSMIHEQFARDVTALFSEYFKKNVHVHVASVDQLTYEEFTRSVPTPTAIAVLKSESLKGKLLLEIDPDITRMMIKLRGFKVKKHHELTNDTKIIMSAIFSKTLAPLQDAWKRIIDLNLSLTKIETIPQFCRIVPPSEMIILVTFECTIGKVSGVINLCLPGTTIAPILPRLTVEYWYSGVEKKHDCGGETSLSAALDSVVIPLSVELGKKNLPLKDIKEMRIGTIIELDKPAGEDLKLFAGGVPIGCGEVVVIGENFGIRVNGIAGK